MLKQATSYTAVTVVILTHERKRLSNFCVIVHNIQQRIQSKPIIFEPNQVLSSDHAPINTKIINKANQLFIRSYRAEWETFRAITNEKLNLKIPTNDLESLTTTIQQTV